MKTQNRAERCVNEAAVLQSLLPLYLPIFDIWDDHELSTIPSQPWDNELGLQLSSGLSTYLTRPKPDQTIGWSEQAFECGNALALLGPNAQSVTETPYLVFSIFTVEGKGIRGGHRVSRLQTLWNGSLMLQNFLKLRTAAGKDQDFFDKIRVAL